VYKIDLKCLYKANYGFGDVELEMGCKLMEA
jgi:hypothetical protein